MLKFKQLEMQKIIIDTNVIVSALISSSYPSFILYDLIFKNKVRFCLSNEIYLEYIEVLSKDKFNRFKEFKFRADTVISKLEEISEIFEPTLRINIIKDLSDNKFLELASKCAADFLITGNSQDFIIDEFEYTRIISPKNYWENFRTKTTK
jgi:uncharacterized protein